MVTKRFGFHSISRGAYETKDLPISINFQAQKHGVVSPDQYYISMMLPHRQTTHGYLPPGVVPLRKFQPSTTPKQMIPTQRILTQDNSLDNFWIGIIQVEIFWVVTTLGGNYLGGNCPGGSYPGQEFSLVTVFKVGIVQWESSAL